MCGNRSWAHNPKVDGSNPSPATEKGNRFKDFIRVKSVSKPAGRSPAAGFDLRLMS